MNIIKYITFISLLVFSSLVLASVKIATMTLQDNMVTFTTLPAKPDTGLACVDSSLKDTWASAIDTYTGRALYTMLVTAVSANLDVEIDSSGDCKDASNIERPAMVRVTAQAVATQPTTSGINIGQKLAELTPFGIHYRRLWSGGERAALDYHIDKLADGVSSNFPDYYLKDGGSKMKIGMRGVKYKVVNITNQAGLFAGFVTPYMNVNSNCTVDVALDGISRSYYYEPNGNAMKFVAGATRSSDYVAGRVMLTAAGAASLNQVIPFQNSINVDMTCHGDFGEGKYGAVAYQITSSQ